MPTDSAATAFGAHPSRSRAQLAEEFEVSLTGTLNLRRTGLRLLTLLTPELADWAALVLPDARTGGLAFSGGDELGFSDIIPRNTAASSVLNRVLRTGHRQRCTLDAGAVIGEEVSGIVGHPRLCEEVAGRCPADVLALGLTARGTTLGAVVLVRFGGRRFDDEEIAFIERLASRAAVALDSARIYEERGRIAAALQRGLRPPTLPDVEGLRVAARYRPAAEHIEVGGDFYDITGGPGDWLFALGDVCGKGIDAAAYTGRTRQSIRTAAYFDLRPEVVLGAVNTVLYDPGSDEFVTVVCARVRPQADGRSAEVDLAVAGHPAPIVLRADGHVEQLEVFGTAAGVRPQVTYRPSAVRLERGDTMLMFTDGVDEARGSAGFYGVDRLLRFLPAYAGAAPDIVCEAVEQDVLTHLDGNNHDDLALLAVTCGS